jgi:serine/threonine-protein kinase
MAPEQVKGGAIDRRVDLFAMGIVLYALTTGKHPFRRESEAATMYNICSPTPVLPPRKVIPEYPAELELVVVKALAKDPDRRYQTANEMLKALDQLPQSMRASTDEDVGKFVMSLFGDKRAERHTAMSEALVRAEELARTRAAAPLAMAPELMQQAAHSQVSYVTRTGVTANNEVSGVPSLTAATGALTGFGQNSPRRRLVMGAAMVALGLLAIGLVVALKSRSGSQTEAVAPRPSAEPSLSAAVTGEVKDVPSTSPSSGANTANTAADIPTAATAEVGVDPTNKASKAGPRVPKSAASANAAGAQPSASPKVKPPEKAWKQDPGF